MRSVLMSSMRLRTLVVALALTLAAAAGWRLPDVPLEAVPEFSPLMIEVKTEALGLSSSEVEALVTVPLEADLLNGVPFLQRITSESGAGVSSITMFFQPGTDLMRARQMVAERLTQTHALPQVSTPPVMLQPVSSTSRIMNIGLSSDRVSLIEMTVQAHWNIVPRLIGVPGVANVSIWGRRDRQVHVEVDPAELHRRGITLEQIVKTAGEAVFASPLTYLNSSTPGTGGFIDTPNQRLNIRHLSPINSPDRFGRVAIHETTLPLDAAARVTEGHQPLIGDAIVGNGPGLLLVVEKLPGHNTQAVTRDVERAMNELRPGLPGVLMDTNIYRPAGYIERATGNLGRAAALSLAILLAALLLLSTGWRAALIGVVAIPLSVLAAALVLHLRGVNFDMLVVAGLLMAIGAVIHDALLDEDAIGRRLRRVKAEGRPAGYFATLADGAMAARGAMLFATVIVLLAVAPVLFLDGQSRAFFAPLVLAYAMAIVASLVVALTVTPALAVLLMRHAPAEPPRGLGIMDALAGLNARHLAPLSRGTGPSLGIVALGIVVTLGAWLQMHRELLPTFKETDIVIDWEAAPGTSLPAMRQVTQRMMQELRGVPGVRNVAAQIGRAVFCNCGDVADVNSAEVWVSVDPGADYSATQAALRQVVASFPGMSGTVDTYLSRKLREALTGEEDRLTVRLYGQDLKVLETKADEIVALIRNVPGVRSPRVEERVDYPTVEVEVDLDRAARFGLKPGEVRRTTATLVNGITVGALFEEQKVFNVVVWGPERNRQNITSIENLMLDTEAGRQVRLSDIARVRATTSPGIIRREGSSRRLDIEVPVGGRTVSAVARDVAARVSQVNFPFEHHASVLGEHQQRRAAFRAIDSYLLAAAVVAFLVLQAALRSWSLAAAAILGVPVVLLGVAVATLLAGATISLGTIFGAGAALVLAVRCGIMLVRHFQALEQDGVPFGDELITRGLAEQFQTTAGAHILTAVCTLPIVVVGPTAGLEILHPMAVALLGGTMGSLAASLVLTPACYRRLGEGTARDALGLETAAA